MKKSIKIILTIFLISLCSICCTFSILFAPQKAVYADENIDNNLRMIYGAQLYLNDNSGLRFGYNVTDYNEETSKDKNYGMLIVPFDYLSKSGIEYSAIGSNGIDYVTALQNAYTTDKIEYAPIIKENIYSYFRGEWLCR